jgi:hypothetical protein
MATNLAGNEEAEGRMQTVAVHEGLIQDSLQEAIHKIKAGIDLEKTKRSSKSASACAASRR